jgi:glycosyltransferase involved in cell wall biosynthesis
MRVFYCTRLFSGLEASVRSGVWSPTGVPTIYKMIERLDREDDVTLVLSCKDGNVRWDKSESITLAFKGLRTPARVLAGRARLPAFLSRGRGALLELIQLAEILKLVKRTRPDICYFDHANIIAAAVTATLFRIPVVFRAMGVYPVMREALTGQRLALRILRWCYRRRFALVVCSQDGSGVEPWLSAALDPKVPREVLLNGFDRDSIAGAENEKKANDGKVSVVFLGKLEPEKGALEFARAFVDARKRLPDQLRAIMVGTGRLKEPVETVFKDGNAKGDLALHERLPHREVAEILGKSDIYVSLNYLGNLSNANLEAMSAGACMVIPQPQPALGIDVATRAILPDDAAFRIPSAADTGALTDALVSLAQDPQRRSRLSIAAAAAAKRNIPTWHDRIEREYRMLQSIAQTQSEASRCGASRAI